MVGQKRIERVHGKRLDFGGVKGGILKGLLGMQYSMIGVA
jgi:hypothetical protein